MFPFALTLELKKNAASLRDESNVVRLSQNEGRIIELLVIHPLAKHTVIADTLHISDAYARILVSNVGKKTKKKLGFPLIERSIGCGYRLVRQVEIKKRDP